MPDDKSGNESPRQVQQLVEAWSVGLMFPVAIGVGFAWGWGMDKLFGTRPWLTWIFTAFGVIAAFVNLFRIGLRNDGSGG
jgi:ATP synthase protein I